MIRRLWLSISSAVMLLACIVTVSHASARIEFASEKLDVGTAVEGNLVKVEFPFKNVGDSELEITKVSSVCDCTSVEATKSKIAPGESAKIQLTFRNLGYSGKVTKAVDIYTNDPNHVGVRLRFIVEVLPVAKMEPGQLNIGTIKPGTTVKRTVILRPVDTKTFTVSKTECVGTHVSVSSLNQLSDKIGPYYEMSIEIKAGRTTGRFFDGVSVCGSTGDAKAYLPVFGNVVE